MHKLLIAFTARPGHGSEGGVGWAFVKAAAAYAAAHRETVHLIVDSRDEEALKRALAALPANEFLRVHGVSSPRWLARIHGESRSRMSYLAWLPAARRTVARLVARGDIDVAHQVTFATAILPSALPRRSTVKRVWGPLSVPSRAVRPRGAPPAWWRETPIRLSRWIALRNARRAELLLANNHLAASHLQRLGKSVMVEPNIAVDVTQAVQPRRDANLLAIVGLLIDRKRPWLAIEAIAHPLLSHYHLQVIGDGPLRGQMEALSETLGVADRVRFLGRLPHDDALTALAASRLLLHPAAREGSPWVIGEAAALGVPAVAFSDVGAASTVLMSDNGGEVADPVGDLAESLARAAHRVLVRPVPDRSNRWLSARFTRLLDDWWRT